MAERDVVRKVVAVAKKLGWTPRRFEVENHDPDYVFFANWARTVFVEFKDLLEVPREGQLRRHEEFRELGFDVYVIDNAEEGIALFDRLTNG